MNTSKFDLSVSYDSEITVSSDAEELKMLEQLRLNEDEMNEKEKEIKEMQYKVQQYEKQIHDLQIELNNKNSLNDEKTHNFQKEYLHIQNGVNNNNLSDFQKELDERNSFKNINLNNFDVQSQKYHDVTENSSDPQKKIVQEIDCLLENTHQIISQKIQSPPSSVSSSSCASSPSFESANDEPNVDSKSLLDSQSFQKNKNKKLNRKGKYVASYKENDFINTLEDYVNNKCNDADTIIASLMNDISGHPIHKYSEQNSIEYLQKINEDLIKQNQKLKKNLYDLRNSITRYFNRHDIAKRKREIKELQYKQRIKYLENQLQDIYQFIGIKFNKFVEPNEILNESSAKRIIGQASDRLYSFINNNQI